MDEEKLQDKSGAYPAAEFLAPYALEDYQRLQKRYDDISRRAGIALLASIVTMAGMLYRVDCIIHAGLLSPGIIFTTRAIVYLFKTFKSDRVPVFNSEELITEKVYKGTPEQAASYLLYKYINICHEMRPFAEKKQARLDDGMGWLVLGIVVYIAGIIMAAIQLGGV
jgi:hypothetical protein